MRFFVELMKMVALLSLTFSRGRSFSFPVIRSSSLRGDLTPSHSSVVLVLLFAARKDENRLRMKVVKSKMKDRSLETIGQLHMKQCVVR